MKILAEFLPVINSINIYINLKDPEQIVKINVEKSRIILDRSGVFTNIDLCKGILLKPDFLSGLRCESDWLSFRVQLDEKTRIVNSVLGELIRDISSLTLKVENKEDKILNQPLCIHCKSCGSPLTATLTIKNLKTLPSVDWDSLSEDWFCHLNDSDKPSVKKTNVIPKENECFYSEMLFCVNSEILLTNNSTNFVTCKNCNLTIGYKKANMIKFWSHDIEFITENKLLLSKSSSEILVSLFHNLDKDSLGANSRLVLEKMTTPKKFIFLVTMDTHLTLLVTENSSLLSGKSNIQNHEADVDEKFPPKKQKTLCSEPVSYDLEKIKAIKLLYRIKVGEDDESGGWVDDVNIHMLSCGESLFNSVLKLLENSNDCLPVHLKMVNDMKIGYVVKT